MHFRVNFFRQLHELTGTILCFGKKGPPRKYFSISKADFPHYCVWDLYLLKNDETYVINDVFAPLFKYRPDIVITEGALGVVGLWFLFILQPIFKFRLILWTHGYDRKTAFNPKQSFIDKLRAWSMHKADAIIFYSQQGKEIVGQHIKNSEKMFVAPNTLDTIKLTELRTQFEERGKDAIKNEVGFVDKYNLVFVGRLLREKEPDRLIEVFEILSSRLESIGLHIIGDGPMRELLKDISAGLNVKFYGNIIDDRKVGQLLFASDLMIMPGYLGLSVVHSFCFDKPVVSQKKGIYGPFHSPEADYVIDGKTGFMVEYGKNNLMSDIIISYLKNEKKQEDMKREIRSMVANVCSMGNMMNGFLSAINYVRNL